jgi:hypothetical protein
MAEIIRSNYSKETFPELFNLRFGMTKNEVKELYQKRSQRPIFERPDRLDFICPPVELPGSAETNLTFERNKLTEVCQYFEVVNDEPSAFKHIAKYRDLKDQLSAKYGTPESIEFMEDNYNNGDHRLEGFKSKKGNYASMWRNVRKMDVFLVLGGDNLAPFLRLTYKVHAGN